MKRNETRRETNWSRTKTKTKTTREANLQVVEVGQSDLAERLAVRRPEPLVPVEREREHARLAQRGRLAGDMDAVHREALTQQRPPRPATATATATATAATATAATATAAIATATATATAATAAAERL